VFALHHVLICFVVAWTTNLGWMMGPWLLYASLLNGATIALYKVRC
jgi:acyl-coenzyme A synthetase/AMP-(fatty) acid ligase